MKLFLTRSIIISILVSVIAILSGSFGWDVQIALVGLAFFIAGISYKPLGNIHSILFYLIMIFPFALIYDLHVFMDRLDHVYPIAIIPYFALLIGMLLSSKIKQKPYVYYGAIGMYLILMIMSWRILMPSYLTYTLNKDFIAIEDDNLNFPNIEVFNSRKEKIDLSSFDSKVLVLDIWTSTCGSCFKRFPDFQTLSKQYSDRDDIAFYGLNRINYNDNLDSIISTADNLPYDFPHLFTSHSTVNEIKDKLKVSSFPIIVVRDKKGKLTYIGGPTVYMEGTYRNAKSVIDNLL